MFVGRVHEWMEYDGMTLQHSAHETRYLALSLRQCIDGAYIHYIYTQTISSTLQSFQAILGEIGVDPCQSLRVEIKKADAPYTPH